MKNNKGSILIPVLVIIIMLLLLLLVVGGFFYYTNKKLAAITQNTETIDQNNISNDSKINAEIYPVTTPTITDTVSVKNDMVFINGNLPVVDANPKTFVLLGNNYAKDSTHIWHYDTNGIKNENQLAQNVDIASFAPLNDIYIKDRNGVYTINLFKIVPGIDPVTVSALDNRNIKDKNHAYDFMGNIFSNIVDVKNLVSVASDETVGSQWFKDSVHVYTGNGEILDQADPKTFTDLGIRYGKDATHIFYGSTTSFLETDSTPMKGFIVSGADINTFVVEKGYAKDSSHIFATGHILTGADVTTFKQIGNNNYYFKDKNHVWYSEEMGGITQISNADVKTFTVDSNNSSTAQDAHNRYGFANMSGAFIVTPKNN